MLLTGLRFWVVIFGSLAAAWSQVASGTITGSVEDPTGAAIVGAVVSLKHTATGETRATVTNERGEFTATFPKVRFAVLRLSAGTEAPNCNPKVCATPPALAVKVADCTEVTGETLALNVAVLVPAGTVTVAGTATAPLLLARLTPNPLLSAAAFKVTEQLSRLAPVIDPLAQVSAVSTGTPVPLRLTEVEDPFVASLATFS